MKFSNLFCVGLLTISAHTSYAEAPQLKSGVQFEHVMTIGSQGSGDGQFRYIEDLAWDSDDNLMVTDAVNVNIQVFDRMTGKFIKKFGSKGEGKTQFEKPEGIAVDPDGNIFISDHASGYIKKFDKHFNHLKTFAEFGTEPGENMDAEFMDIANGLLYMADSGNNQIDIFDLEGNFKFELGGEELSQILDEPESVKIDSQNNIWVNDTGNNRVQLYSSAGKFIQQWGKEGDAPGEFRKPMGLAIDQYDNIYIGEVNNDRIQIFDKDFNFITMWGKPGNKNGEFGNIHGIVVDERGHVYVGDTANNRIQVFKPVIK